MRRFTLAYERAKAIEAFERTLMGPPVVATVVAMTCLSVDR